MHSAYQQWPLMPIDDYCLDAAIYNGMTVGSTAVISLLQAALAGCVEKNSGGRLPSELAEANIVAS